MSPRSGRSVQVCCDCGLLLFVRGAAGDAGRLLEALEGRPLSRRWEDLEESEKETLWPGESKLPSEVRGRCHSR